MKIKELEYLPALSITLDRVSVEGVRYFEDVDVSLFGHWVHVRDENTNIRSFPTSRVQRIDWL